MRPIPKPVWWNQIRNQQEAAVTITAISVRLPDDTGGLHPEVLYYTEQGAPLIYLTNKGAHFVARQRSADSTAPDTLYRVTMEFKCSGYPETDCGSIATYEEGVDSLNYYLPHCSS